MTVDAKGEFACLKFDIRAIEKGGVVSKPIYDAPYDRILDLNDRLYKVQIKFRSPASTTQGAILLKNKRASRHKNLQYTNNDIDAIVVYIAEVDKLCWFDIELFDSKSSIHLRYKPAKNGQQKDINLIEDYEW